MCPDRPIPGVGAFSLGLAGGPLVVARRAMTRDDVARAVLEPLIELHPDFVPARLDLGRSLEEILGKTDFDFFPPDLARKYQADDRRVMETGKPLRN